MRNHARAEGVLQRFGAGEAALNEDGCGCGCAALNENGCGFAAQNENENGCGCAAQNENGCGFAAQNENEVEVDAVYDCEKWLYLKLDKQNYP
jgi:hypothetical protein